MVDPVKISSTSSPSQGQRPEKGKKPTIEKKDIDPEVIDFVNIMKNSTSATCKDFFTRSSVEDIGALDIKQLKEISRGLQGNNDNYKAFLIKHSPKKLKILNDEKLFTISRILEQQPRTYIHFFQQRTPKEINALDNSQLRAASAGAASHRDVCSDYFKKYKLEDFSALSEAKLNQLTKGLESHNQICSDYFKSCHPKDLESVNMWTLESMVKALSSHVPECAEYFKKYKLKDLQECDSEKILRIKRGLENDESQSYFQNNSLHALHDLDLPTLEALSSSAHSETADALEADRAQETAHYLRHIPEGISEETMRNNIDGLFGVKIKEIIAFSKRAEKELIIAPQRDSDIVADVTIKEAAEALIGITAKDIYKQPFDKKAFLKAREQLYIIGAAKGLFPAEAAEDVIREVTAHLKAGDMRELTGAGSDIAEAAEETYKHIKRGKKG